MLPFLRCPACRAAALAETGEGLRCGSCGATFRAVEGIPLLSGPAAARVDGVTQGISAYYDVAAGEYEMGHGIGRPGGDWSIARKYVPLLRRLLAPGDAVLEIGAGTGKLTEHLVGLAGTVIASDIAPGMLRFGRARNGLGAAVVADAEALPFRDGAFDAVVAMNALSYCVHKDAALAEAYRVLKPGGRLVLIDMNYLVHVPYLLLGLKEWKKARLWTAQLLESTPWGWRRRVTRAGFAVEESFAFNWVPHRFSRAAVAAVFAPLDAVLSRLPLVRRCAMRLAVIARKPRG